jgi:uncharacterized metal-binding protein
LRHAANPFALEMTTRFPLPLTPWASAVVEALKAAEPANHSRRFIMFDGCTTWVAAKRI